MNWNWKNKLGRRDSIYMFLFCKGEAMFLKPRKIGKMLRYSILYFTLFMVSGNDFKSCAKYTGLPIFRWVQNINSKFHWLRMRFLKSIATFVVVLKLALTSIIFKIIVTILFGVTYCTKMIICLSPWDIYFIYRIQFQNIEIYQRSIILESPRSY